jgi:radical SAM protein with 4Fe4S-binding SPASM domain
MRCFLSARCVIRRLESPCVYNIESDELYELDDEASEFLARCASPEGCEPAKSEREFTDYCLNEGILAAADPGVIRPPSNASPVPSLRYLELQITRRCNLRCRHCYIGPPEDSELTPIEVGKIVGEFEAMQGLRVIITGGEPLVHRDFPAINSLLPNYSVRKILETNGTLITKRVLEGLNVDEIQVSIDGFTAAHEALRGRGTFRCSMSAIELAISAGFDVSVSTMVHSENLDDFKGLEKTFRSMGVKDWTVDIPCPAGNLKENPSFSLPPEEAGRFLGYGWGEGLHGGGADYACGLHLMSVMADGGCARCSFYSEKPVGNFSEGLGKCWLKITPIRLDKLKCDCNVLETCRGGCRYRAALLGDPHGKDLYRCKFFDKL